jgi:hypothetical protein
VAQQPAGTRCVTARAHTRGARACVRRGLACATPTLRAWPRRCGAARERACGLAQQACAAGGHRGCGGRRSAVCARAASQPWRLCCSAARRRRRPQAAHERMQASIGSLRAGREGQACAGALLAAAAPLAERRVPAVCGAAPAAAAFTHGRSERPCCALTRAAPLPCCRAGVSAFWLPARRADAHSVRDGDCARKPAAAAVAPPLHTRGPAARRLRPGPPPRARLRALRGARAFCACAVAPCLTLLDARRCRVRTRVSSAA